MMNNLKIAAVGALAALGFASAAVAQQSGAQKPNMPVGQHQQMKSGSMHNGQMMATMADPQMRQQMMEMMKGCNQMMQHMGDMSQGNTKPKS